ncbi:MAG TPA: ankyrin repeat domain-containing protein [Chryseolinea sp.]|nr:ankyrin repeat domain-containing protein [Chryseolinea sp.]
MNAPAEILELIKSGDNQKLERGLKENPALASAKTEHGISLLQFAAYCRNKNAIDLLRAHIKEPDIFEAAAIGDLQTLKKHLKKSPDLLNAFAPDGFTCLGLSVYFGNANIVEYLISKGADVNIASNNAFKVAPIHSACAISDYNITELLLRSGANVNARQQQGITSLHSAAHNGQTKLAELLIDNGADINAKTDSGQTPLAMALEKNFAETADMLERRGAV